MKKRYLVLTLLFVCVLLGALLYINLASAGKPESGLYKGSVEIVLSDFVSRHYNEDSLPEREYDISVGKESMWWMP